MTRPVPYIIGNVVSVLIEVGVFDKIVCIHDSTRFRASGQQDKGNSAPVPLHLPRGSKERKPVFFPVLYEVKYSLGLRALT